MVTVLPLSAALAVAAANPPAAATDPWSFDWRYRHESVSDDAFARDAEADTLRLRAGFKHAIGGWTAFIEAEGVAELGDRFNSGANGQTQYPVVLDARALEVNQAWMDWRGTSFGTRLGRQRIVLDNARFVGNVGWRQNEQTFDAAHLEWKPTQDWQVQAYWLGTVHRPAGDNAKDPLARERKLDGRLLRTQATLPNGALVGYGYWIEDREVRSASTRTLGLRWTAAWPLHEGWKLGTTLEAAQQAPYAAASGGNTYYSLVEPRIEYGPYALRLGWERLGTDLDGAFQTPLATLHAFNGWADKFLVTPADGLEDRYAAAQGALDVAGRTATWQVAFHDFQSDRGADYGREWDASLGVVLRPGLVPLVKLADYRSDGFARDTRKLWFQVEWSY